MFCALLFIYSLFLVTLINVINDVTPNRNIICLAASHAFEILSEKYGRLLKSFK